MCEHVHSDLGYPTAGFSVPGGWGWGGGWAWSHHIYIFFPLSIRRRPKRGTNIFWRSNLYIVSCRTQLTFHHWSVDWIPTLIHKIDSCPGPALPTSSPLPYSTTSQPRSEVVQGQDIFFLKTGFCILEQVSSIADPRAVYTEGRGYIQAVLLCWILGALSLRLR